MATNRVKSKNLFNFRPRGVIDDDILVFDEEMKVKFNIDAKEMAEMVEKQTEEEFVAQMRVMMDSYLSSSPFSTDPGHIEAYDSCNNTEIRVATSHDGQFNVPVLVHTPKFLADKRDRACIIYAHGGGAIACSAETHSRFLAHMAMDCGIVVFNVDYRLAPETRCPNNVLDFYEVIKYVASNASELGIDPSKIAIAGESGGGYICAGAMVQLALQSESSLVKLAIPVIAMMDDYEFGNTESMTKVEAEAAASMMKLWKVVGGPEFEAKRKAADPLLFPAKANAELLAKMPPTIIWEAEFDQFNTMASRFAQKLREAGRLLELVVIPGAKHGSGMSPQFKAYKVERQAWRFAIQEYLIKE